MIEHAKSIAIQQVASALSKVSAVELPKAVEAVADTKKLLEKQLEQVKILATDTFSPINSVKHNFGEEKKVETKSKPSPELSNGPSREPTIFGDLWWEQKRDPTIQKALQDLEVGDRHSLGFARVKLLEGGNYKVSPTQKDESNEAQFMDSKGKWHALQGPMILAPGSSVRLKDGISIVLPPRKLPELDIRETFSVGRDKNSGFVIDSKRTDISRHQFSLERTNDGMYVVRNLSKKSKSEKWDSEKGWVVLKEGQNLSPGTCLRLAGSYQLEIAPQKIEGLPKGKWVSIGTRGDILTPSSAYRVKDEHLTLKNNGSGFYEVLSGTYDKNRAMYLDERGKWKAVTSGQFLHAGTKVKLGTDYTIELGSTANREFKSSLRAVRLESQLQRPSDPSLPKDWQQESIGHGVFWTGPEPEQVMNGLRHSGKFIQCKERGDIPIYGETTWFERRRLQSEFDRRYSGFERSQMPHIERVYVAKPGSLGKLQLGNQSWDVEAIDADTDGKLLITNDAIYDREKSRELMEKLKTNELTRRHHLGEIKTYTEGYNERINREGRFRPSVQPWAEGQSLEKLVEQARQQKDAPHGYYVTDEKFKRPILARDMENLNGSAYVCSSNRPVMIIDDMQYPELARTYDRFLETRLARYREEGELSETDILYEICGYSREQFPGPKNDLELEEEMQEYMKEKYGEKEGGYGEISLHEYIDAGKGVCIQHAAFTGYLLQRLKQDGLVTGNFSFERARRDVGGLGHAWVRYQFQNGDVYFVDPAQQEWAIHSRDVDRECWPYMRGEDADRKRRQPL